MSRHVLEAEPSPSTGELVPVKFSRLTRRGILLGLSLSQLITLAIGILSIVGALYAGGGILLAYTAPVWVLAAALTWIPVAGRPMVEWLPVAFWWLWRTTGGQLLYRRRIVIPRPVGTLALPGDMARLREYTDPDTGAGMIHDPHASTLTVVCEVTHPAFVLLDPGEQERRVSSWGRVLATVCRSGASPPCRCWSGRCRTPAPGWPNGGSPTVPPTTPGPRPPTPSSSTVPGPPGNATPPPLSLSAGHERRARGRSGPPAAASAAPPRCCDRR